MAEEGVPYRADTGGSGATSPDLRAPLGEPFIIKPEDWIALQKAGDQNAAFTNAFKGASSLVDNAFNQRLEREKAQAGLAETTARTAQIGAQTDNLQTESDQRQQLTPLLVKQYGLKLKTDQFGLDTAEKAQLDFEDASNRAKEAMTSLPDYNDPDYQNKMAKWQQDNAHLISRPDAIGKQLQTAYGLVDGRVKATSDFQRKLGQVQEFNDLQKGGYINSPANADAQVFGGTAEPTLVSGRMAKNLDQLSQLIADPRMPQAQKAQLTNLYNYGKGFLGSDTGAADVMANKAHELFNVTGNFSGTAQGLVNGVSAMLGKETKPAEVEQTIYQPLKPGQIKPTELKVKGTAEQVQQVLTPREAQEQRQTTLEAIQKAGIPDTQENRADQAAYQRGEINPDELARRINSRALPPARPAPAPTPPVSAPPNTSAASPATDSTLAASRTRIAQELSDNPDLRRKLMASTDAEVGDQNDSARQAYIESVMNRAIARNQSLDETISSLHDPKTGQGYYPLTTISKLSRTPSRAVQDNLNPIIERALAGSNISGFATGNQSGKVKSRGAPITFDPRTGEQFVIENDDADWAAEMRRAHRIAAR